LRRCYCWRPAAAVDACPRGLRLRLLSNSPNGRHLGAPLQEPPNSFCWRPAVAVDACPRGLRLRLLSNSRNGRHLGAPLQEPLNSFGHDRVLLRAAGWPKQRVKIVQAETLALRLSEGLETVVFDIPYGDPPGNNELDLHRNTWPLMKGLVWQPRAPPFDQGQTASPSHVGPLPGC